MKDLIQNIDIYGLAYLNEHIVLGNSLTDRLIAVLVLFVCLAIFWWFRKKLLKGLSTLTADTETGSDDFVVKTIQVLPKSFYWIIAIFIATQFLVLPDLAQQIIDIAFIILAISQIGFTLGRVLLHFLHKNYLNGEGGEQTVGFLRILVKGVVFVVVALMILNNIGIEITPLITSLGIVGIAVAFALQNILEDLFSSISLIIDKPFVVGDFIEINDQSGIVKSVGIKTTRITTIRGEELVIANRKLTNETLRNFGKMDHRTITSTITIAYPDKNKKLETFPKKLEEVFESIEKADLLMVFLTTLQGNGAEFTYRYLILSNEYAEYLEKQQQINFALLKMLETENLSVAVPTQAVNITKEIT